MMSPRWISTALLLLAGIAGTLSDVSPQNPPMMIGGYRVLAADFHVHSAILGSAGLAPWDLVLQGRREGLDVFAITDHNQAFTSRIGRWFSRLIGGPMILTGEEVRTARFHIIAVGIEHTVNWNQPAAAVIDEIHRRGGVAIAAHPIIKYWPAFDAEAMRRLDGSEVVHPVAFSGPGPREELRQFYYRRRLTAIGSSDYHGIGALGQCRTYVFVHDTSEQAILEALRQGHTVVYDPDGSTFGDPDLIRLAAQDGRLRNRAPSFSKNRLPAIFSRTCAALGLIGLIVFGFRKPSISSERVAVLQDAMRDSR